jgi:hypothetical protein
LRATSALCEATAWISYDGGHHGVGQQYFAHALRLASAAGDRSYGAYVLSSMSDQALFLGHPEHALRLARAAGETAGSAHAVRAEASLLQARALGVMQDRRGCELALLAAEAAGALAAGTDSDLSVPIGVSVIAGHAGTCWLDLGDPEPAEKALRVSLEAANGQPRRRIYYSVHLAHVAVLRNDLEQACALGSESAELLGRAPSSRSAHHLRLLASRISDLGYHRAGDFLDRARAALLVIPTADDRE